MAQRTRQEWASVGVTVGEEVDLSGIADEAIIHPGCRISGETVSIGPGSELGGEAPVILQDCQLGQGVKLKGGYFAGSVFLDGANVGSGAHVRAGCLLEEEANGAHCVGLKQTILLPFVTLGSLINFCDILMAGGTSRKDHSEVGSSFIHFNYTPHQDKATPSLVGDVPDGVFMDRKPIFLGGQGGLVGPARIAYGSVIAAGGVCRQDIMEPGQLHIPEQPAGTTRAYETGVYRRVNRIVRNNLAYIGNLMALREWYERVRSVYMLKDRFSRACHEGAIRTLNLVLAERIKRLGELAAKMEYSSSRLSAEAPAAIAVAEQRRFFEAWPEIEFELAQQEWTVNEMDKSTFLTRVHRLPLTGYMETIRGLEPEARQAGSRWMQSIVDAVVELWPTESA